MPTIITGQIKFRYRTCDSVIREQYSRLSSRDDIVGAVVALRLFLMPEGVQCRSH